MRPRPIKTDIAGIEVIDGYRLVTSYSQIDMYLKCPQQWNLKYVENNRSEDKQLALEYGLTIHETMEYFFNMRVLGITPSEDDVKDFYLKTFREREIPFEDEDQEDQYFKDGLIAISGLYNPRHEVEKIMTAEDTEILGVEEEFEIVIKLPKEIEVAFIDVDGQPKILKSDEVIVMGYIDLILKTPEGIVCIDHKSGKKAFDKAKLEHNLQFPIYAIAIRDKFGVLPNRSLYNFTKAHKTQEVVISESRLVEAEEEMIKVFKKMKGAKHTCKPTFLCYWCDFSVHKQNICTRSSDFKPKNAK